MPRSATAILLTFNLPTRHTSSLGGTDYDTRRTATGIDLPDVLHHAATLAMTVPLAIPFVNRTVWPIGAAGQGDTCG